MNLYWKLLGLILARALWPKSQEFTDPCVSNFRVGFWDLDLNFHMNNGRFLSVMDLGRLDMLMRTGNLGKLFKKGYYPVILSESIIFKKSLSYFNRYQLHTAVESWDRDFFYISQKFVKNEEISASANVRACFKKRGRKGIVPVTEIFSFLGEPHEEQNLGPIVQKQIELDNLLLPRK